MLRLGHIDFTNCVPVHALLLARPDPGIALRFGTPAELNSALAAGTIDVAPCSSIEYARHASRYRVLPGLAIGSDGPVRSIVLESALPPDELHDRIVALPTVSATSVVLLRLLLEVRLGVSPRYRWFDQAAEHDSIGDADAALWIGDAALQRRPVAGRQVLDLGSAWQEWTGLPFTFAVWQTWLGPDADGELERLHGRLLESLAYFRANSRTVARQHGSRIGIEPRVLLNYWSELRYDLDASMLQGLERFYRLATTIGEAPPAPAVRWTPARRAARAVPR